jgi:hypothetical protein
LYFSTLFYIITFHCIKVGFSISKIGNSNYEITELMNFIEIIVGILVPLFLVVTIFFILKA